MFVDGVEKANEERLDIVAGAYCAYIGLHPYAADPPRFNWKGSIDEVRVSSVGRSTNWIWACWMCTASNDVFNTYSPVSVVYLPHGTMIMIR